MSRKVLFKKYLLSQTQQHNTTFPWDWKLQTVFPGCTHRSMHLYSSEMKWPECLPHWQHTKEFPLHLLEHISKHLWNNRLKTSATKQTIFIVFYLKKKKLRRTRLQHGLELTSHADLVLFLAHDALDRGGQATGVAWEYESVAVITCAVVLQGAASVGDSVVVVIGVNDPVVVTCMDNKQVNQMNRMIWYRNWAVLGTDV